MLYFLVTVTTDQLINVGLSWRKQHNPVISFSDKKLLNWSTFCLEDCTELPCTQLAFMSIKIPKIQNLIDISTSYYQFSGTIYFYYNLFAGLPAEYVQEALHRGCICPSTLPAAAGFFFVEKKEGGLLRFEPSYGKICISSAPGPLSSGV